MAGNDVLVLGETYDRWDVLFSYTRWGRILYHRWRNFRYQTLVLWVILSGEEETEIFSGVALILQMGHGMRATTTFRCPCYCTCIYAMLQNLEIRPPSRFSTGIGGSESRKVALNSSRLQVRYTALLRISASPSTVCSIASAFWGLRCMENLDRDSEEGSTYRLK